MEIHHDRNHQAYVDNLNKAIAGTDAENASLEDILKNVSKYSAAVRNNGGGHYNHKLFWSILSPNGGGEPKGELAEAIKRVALVTDRGHHLRMQVTEAGVLTLTAGGDDEGRAEEDLGVEADGAELLIAFNPSYLLDGLGVLRADTVRLAFTTPSRPALLLPLVTKDNEQTVDGAYRYLVMPARLPG